MSFGLKKDRWFLLYGLILGLFFVCLGFAPQPAKAATGINQKINFQGRLLNDQGATVPDGFYNIEFKIYQDGDGQSAGDTTGSPAGSLKWTEDYLNNSSQGVKVVNGFMSVELGSITPFGTNIDWNQDTLWLSMNIGGTGASCTPFSSCSPDGEMLPMQPMTAAPYALNSGLLGGLASSDFLQLAKGVQNDTSTTNPSLFINKNNASGTPNILELQKSGTDVLTVNNSGDLVLGKAGTGGLNGKLVFNTTNASNTSITLVAASTASSYSLTLPTTGPSTSQCLQSDSSTASQLVFGPCGATGTFLAKNATDTSSAAAGSGNLYAFTNSSSASTGSVLKLDNGTNTGSTLSATTSGNPGAGNAVIYGQNTNATPSGNLIDLEAGSTPASKFSVNASGNVVATGTYNTNTFTSTALTFGGASGTVDSASGTALGIGTGANAHAVTVGNTTGASSLTLQAGTGNAGGDINIQTAASGIINIGTSAVIGKVLNLGSVGGTVNASTVHIADTNGNATQSVTIGNTGSANNVILIQGGSTASAISLQAAASGTIVIGTTNNNAVTIGGAGQTSQITLGQGTGTNTVSIGSANGTSATQTINIGAGTSTTSGGKLVNIATGVPGAGTTNTVHIGDGGTTTGTVAVTVGSNGNAAHTTAIQGGSGATAITLTPQTTGQIVIGAAAGTGQITLGSSSAAQTVVVGGGGGVSTVQIAGGSAANVVQIANTQAAGSVSIGAAMTSGTITVGNTGTTTIQGGTTTLKQISGANSTTLNFQAPTAVVTYTLQTAAAGSYNICTSVSSTACSSVYAPATGSTHYLAKDATDTASAAAGSGNLYAFTNSSSASTGSVLKLDNGTNTGSTLSATTSGNPGAGNAVIYGQNTNATPSGNLIDLEAGSTPASKFSVNAAGDITNASNIINGTTLSGSALTFGTASASSVQAATSQALNITGNATSLWQVGGTNQNLTIQTSGTGTLAIDTVGAGTVNLGNTNATTIGIGGANGAITTIGGGNVAHTIHIGDGGTSTAQTISVGSNASTSATTIAAGSGNINFNTSMAQFTEVTGTRTLGIQTRTSNVAGTNFTIQAGAGGSGASAVGGGVLALTGGNAAGTGNANGGNVSITGGAGVGTGVTGAVVIGTPTFTTATADANCYTGGALVASSCTITSASVNSSAAVLVGFNVIGQTASLPDPAIATAGKVIYITAANGSSDFTLSVNGGGTGNTIAMRQNTTATMIWNGSDWTAAGASSSTTLQSAYDNTLQSAGGAELVVSHTSNTNGLTIRDSTTSPVNGTLLSVQTSSAAGLLSVNSNVTEYSSDGGAETAGGTSSTFPSNTWAAVTGSTVSRYTTVGNFIDTGQASVSVATTTSANSGVKGTLSSSLTANMHYNVSFAARLSSGTFTDMNVYYSIDGTAASVACTATQAIITSIWSKVNCTFAAPASGITSSNAILIRQTGSGTARTFYVDNLSVTIAADFNYATDGGVDDSTNFSTNWSFVNSTTGAGSVTRNTSDGNDASDSAGVTITTGAANAGIRNQLAINPLTSTLYRVTVYAKLSTGTFTDFKIRYSRDGSTGSSGNYVDCVDYNTQTIVTTGWTEITCYLTTDSTAATSPYVNFVETTSSARTFYVDTFSMTLTTNTAPNVQVGGGVNGGPITLFTLDRGAAAPIASNNDALLGSMYYDTTLGKLQCYEADGWGACGSSPDNIVTLSPEFTNAVLHGTGIGTMNSDICSDTLNINDGSSGQPTICGTNETFNFYKWTSPQASAQTYSVYVTYQLPTTFKTFASGQTSIMGRTDSTNATVQYEVYRNNSASGLSQCGSTVSVSTGSVSSWQTGVASGAADPSTCGFAGGDSIVFKIDVIASSNADAYVGNLNFTFSNT